MKIAIPGRVRSLWALLAGVGAAIGVLAFVNHQYPIRTWLALPLGAILGWQLALNAGWAGLGLRVTRWLLPEELPPVERLVLGVAAGVVAFGFSLYLLGVICLFKPAAALGLVLAFNIVGWPELARWTREARAAAALISVGGRPGWFARAAAAGGVIGIGLVYLGLLAPDTINYDARWWHLSITEGYVRAGRIISFPGNWVNSYPHMASLLHTWDFLIPGLPGSAARWMMVLHTEFSLFLWTLVGVGAAVRWMAEDDRVRGAWAAYFLFPGLLIYDGNIGGSADHAMAFFVMPLFLLSVRLRGRPPGPGYALWGVVAAGAFLTKLQAMYVIVPLSLLLCWECIRSGDSRRAGLVRALKMIPVVLGAFVLVTAPHFLTNIVFNGNPFYPLLQDWFSTSHPTIPDAPLLVRQLLMDYNWRPPAELGRRLREAFELLFTFAFQPHYSFTNNVPVIGYLFTLSLPLLFSVANARRLWIGALVSLGALFCWANTVRVDRNLQTFLPLLVASSAAILARAWRVGRLARVGVAALLLSQVVWAADLCFAGGASGGISLIRSGFAGQGARRFAGLSPDYLALDRMLPKDAVVLLHHWHPSLGINRPIYLDWTGFQGSIDYRTFGDARAFYDRLRALGITHVVHLPGNQAAPSKQEDVIFHSLAVTYGGPKARVGMFEYFALPASPPPARAPLQVLAVGAGRYADGLYDVTSLGTCQNLSPDLQRYAPPRLPLGAAGWGPLLDASDAVLIGAGHTLDPPTMEKLGRQFKAATPYPGLSVYIRASGP